MPNIKELFVLLIERTGTKRGGIRKTEFLGPS